MEFKLAGPMHNWSFYLGTNFVDMFKAFLFVWIFFNLVAFSSTISLNHLNAHFFFNDFLPWGSFTNSLVSFLCKESVSSCIALNQLLLSSWDLCHKMIQMTLPMGLYRRWKASKDPWRHLHLATKWESMKTSREGYRCPHISTLG